MRNKDAEVIWQAAKSSAKTVLETPDRNWLYVFLVFVQSVRYMARYFLFRIISDFPSLLIRLMKKVVRRSLKETEMIALMRDLGQDPGIETDSPFKSADSPFRELNLTDRILNFLTWDCAEKSFTFEVPEQFFSSLSNQLVSRDWLIEKMRELSSSLPALLLAEGFYGKVARSMTGVIGYCFFQNRHYPAERAAEIGFWFGILYLYDEVLDVPDLVTAEEKRWVSGQIELFLSGKNLEMGSCQADWRVSQWICKALLSIESLCPRQNFGKFYSFLGILAEAQEAEFSQGGSSPEEIYTLIALKSAMTRLIPAALAGWEISEKYIHYALVTGIANQLVDDLRDLPDDIQNSVPTPFVKFFRGELAEHPLKTYFRALEASANFFGSGSRIKTRILWSIRMTHALKILAQKSARRKTLIPLSGLWRQYGNLAGLCSQMIIDCEAEIAKASDELVEKMISAEA